MTKTIPFEIITDGEGLPLEVTDPEAGPLDEDMVLVENVMKIVGDLKSDAFALNDLEEYIRKSIDKMHNEGTSLEVQKKQGLNFVSSGGFNFHVDDFRQFGGTLYFDTSPENIFFYEKFREFVKDPVYSEKIFKNVCEFYQHFDIRCFVISQEDNIISSIDKKVKIIVNDKVSFKLEVYFNIISACMLYLNNIFSYPYLKAYISETFSSSSYIITIEKDVSSDIVEIKVFIRPKEFLSLP